MPRFIERLKSRHTTDGRPQAAEDVDNPHNYELKDNKDQKETDNTPASKQTKKQNQKVSYDANGE